MVGAKAAWGVGILALALWAGVPCAMGQQQSGTPNSGKRSSRRQQNGQRSRNGSSRSKPGVNAGGASAAKSVPQSGTPTLENPRPAATLQTLPNQTLTPGATSVPSNAGGIAPASNGASSGEYTPSQGQASPTTPGGNPSETQGVPTFSSAAQPADANLPRRVNSPKQREKQTAATGRTRHNHKASKSSTQ